MATVEHHLLTSREVAERLRVSLSTLARWRAQRVGPPFIRLSGSKYGRVRYFPLADLSPKTEETD